MARFSKASIVEKIKQPTSTKLSFLELTAEDWLAFALSCGEKKFRGEQIQIWIKQKFISDPNSMSNLGKNLQQKLLEHFDWSLPEIVDSLASEDGSSKLLFKNAFGQKYESVILRYENRISLCVSSQVGCKLACTFCQTGKLGFFKNLTVGEILGQYFVASQIVRKLAASTENTQNRISHVVFMGMGEPLDNYTNVIKTLQMLVSKNEFGLSWRHVTISTSGIAAKIPELAKDVRVSLAVSLHAPRDELRSELMPINRKFPLEILKDSLSQYQQTTGDIITFEYILIKDKNCGIREAKELVGFLHGLKSKVNLIPFNAHPGLPHERPSAEEIRTFQKYLADRHIPAPVRYSKGLDVSAACGQLAAKTEESLTDAPLRRNVVT